MTPLLTGRVDEAWSAVSGSPVFGVALTLAAYTIALWMWERAGRRAWANPVLIAVALIGAVLTVTGVDYDTYLRGGSLVALLLGPATVALAWPLHRELRLVRQAALPILAGVLIGTGVAVAVATGATLLLGGEEDLARSQAPKTATTPVAIALAESVGGIPALTAVLTILTGILAAVVGPRLLTALRIRDKRVRGVAMGTSAHGIGTARMLQESRTEGAFSGLAMALAALVTSLWVPLLVPPLVRLVS